MELKEKYKYRLILDETQSFAMVGQHGKGVTEYFGIPVSLDLNRAHQAAQVDILIGSMSTGLAAGGGFCAGSYHVCKHQVSFTRLG
jgi:serine palmitoyltransferase